VSRYLVKTNKYDLIASRYRNMAGEEVYYEKPQVTLERLAQLELVLEQEIKELERMLK
jgi:type I restriction enzyme M protein